jgi:hypothetical protein
MPTKRKSFCIYNSLLVCKNIITINALKTKTTMAHNSMKVFADNDLIKNKQNGSAKLQVKHVLLRFPLIKQNMSRFEFFVCHILHHQIFL